MMQFVAMWVLSSSRPGDQLARLLRDLPPAEIPPLIRGNRRRYSYSCLSTRFVHPICAH
jgi:hypothetical protein